MEQSGTYRKVVRVEVTGLLHYFNHVINFPADQPFVCLHGPNGVGKTKLLELIAAAMSGQGSALTDVPFLRLTLEFDDSTKLAVEQGHDDEMAAPTIAWEIMSAGGVETVRPNADRARQAVIWLDREGIVRRRMQAGRGLFQVVETGEVVTPSEAAILFADVLPAELKPAEAAVVEFLNGAAVSLIEVGRLKGVEMRSERTGPLRPDHTVVSAPELRAKDLAQRILTARSEYSQTAQLLDSSYPNRLLQLSTGDGVAEDQIRLDYASLAEHQSLLAELGLLSGQQASLTLDESELAPWQRAAIAMHLEDSRQKLAVFNDLRDRVQLFVDVVNSKFNHKSMRVSVRDGFIFASRLGQQGSIPLEGLSSGEQHLLVVMYRLIFETQPGELVLIDEPEISLHVAWQKQFLDDLQRVADLQGVRFIVATHSPQIVGKYSDRMALLGSVE